MADDQNLVLLDTDIGNDIDDALCLAYLLAQPRCELLGITTVTAEPELRARLASVLCRTAGRSVPILPGAADPLAGPAVQGPPPQATALARWEHDTGFPAGEAVEFLRQTIRAHPGDVTLLAIGPLTNVALLFASDPEIPAMLRSLVLMGGAFGAVAGPEWNIHCDPEAAARVYAAPVARHRSVGLDVTTRVRMDAAAFLRRCDVPLLEPVADMSTSWFDDRPEVTFHDPLAGAVIFDPSLVSFATGEVTVTRTPGPEAGSTAWAAAAPSATPSTAIPTATPGATPDRTGPHQVAVDVRPAAFLDHYFRTVAAFAANGSG
ncbi:nucleoside hydrolase [Rugosimonospora africana]|uniref:nucleoside hydrolase n=1 Tax=Rugosimonospora africana TaxID=556532 RepID=UPI001945553D|nr:nucleoside hydrolase [Rugosimonospora africana]